MVKFFLDYLKSIKWQNINSLQHTARFVSNLNWWVGEKTWDLKWDGKYKVKSWQDSERMNDDATKKQMII